ncbi:unnamed protein product [Auanema sp. JU1783]|nr:unnamed protein product [Auanema sp. JU1783]
MAASGIGEAVAAPILGFWTNKCGKIIPPLVASVIISMIGNVIYMCLNEIPLHLRTPALLISRFLNGAGSGNRGTYFAYIAAASDPTDRARSMALSGGGALIGLNVGPAIQMLFTWVGDDGIELGFMRLSMYTCPALLALVINLASIILLITMLDDGLDRNEPEDLDNISTYSIAAANDSDLERNVVSTIRLDVLAVVVCMLTRAARMLITANIESIGSPFSEVMFDLDKASALDFNSRMQAAVGVLTTFMFFIYVFTDYSKWVSERLNCFLAMIALLFFHLITFSWPFLSGNLTSCSRFQKSLNDTSDFTQDWTWCEELRPVNIWFYYISYAIIFGIGLPCLNNSLQSLYSQILGKGRQGTMQGLNQAVGCISRILGPLLMSSVFSLYGPKATWLIEIILISVCLIVWLFVYRRLTPAVEVKEREIVVEESEGVENPACRRSSMVSEISIVATDDVMKRVK